MKFCLRKVQSLKYVLRNIWGVPLIHFSFDGCENIRTSPYYYHQTEIINHYPCLRISHKTMVNAVCCYALMDRFIMTTMHADGSGLLGRSPFKLRLCTCERYPFNFDTTARLPTNFMAIKSVRPMMFAANDYKNKTIQSTKRKQNNILTFPLLSSTIKGTRHQ